jgi:hypothetical protein
MVGDAALEILLAVILQGFTSVSSDHKIFAYVNLTLSLFEHYRESMV